MCNQVNGPTKLNVKSWQTKFNKPYFLAKYTWCLLKNNPVIFLLLVGKEGRQAAHPDDPTGNRGSCTGKANIQNCEENQSLFAFF